MSVCKSGLKASNQDRITSVIKTLISGITYGGIVNNQVSTTCSVTSGDAPGCCNTNAQNSKCISNCPLMGFGSSPGISDYPTGGSVTPNNYTFPPTEACLKVDKTKPITISSTMDCIKAGNCLIAGKCYKGNQQFSDEKPVATVVDYCRDPKVLNWLATQTGDAPGSMLDIKWPASNNPGNAIATLDLWLYSGLNLDQTLEEPLGNIKTPGDLARYLTTVLPMGQTSTDGLIPYLDDSAWWGLARLQGINTLALDFASNKDEINKIYQEILQSCLFQFSAQDDVCGGGLPWQCTANSWGNATNAKASITNLLLLAVSCGAVNFYNDHKVDTNTVVKIGSQNVKVSDCYSQLVIIVQEQFTWLVSPVGDTSRVLGVISNHPKEKNTRGMVYDGIQQTKKCSVPGCWNMHNNYPSASGWDPSMSNCTINKCDGTIFKDWCKGNTAGKQLGSSPWQCTSTQVREENSQYIQGSLNGPTTYNQGMLVFSCVLLSYAFTQKYLDPKNFKLKMYDQNFKLVDLSLLNATDASTLVLNLGIAAAEYQYVNLSVLYKNTKIISDADLGALPCNGTSQGQSEGDKVFFRGIAAYGITALTQYCQTPKITIQKFEKYVDDTASYTWSEIRNPLSNALGSCYHRKNAGSIGPADDCGLSIFFSVKGTATGALILMCSDVSSSKLFGLNAICTTPPTPPPPAPPPTPPPLLHLLLLLHHLRKIITELLR